MATKVLLTVIVDAEDIVHFAEAAKRGLPLQCASYSSVVGATDRETLAAALAEHAAKLARDRSAGG